MKQVRWHGEPPASRGGGGGGGGGGGCQGGVAECERARQWNKHSTSLLELRRCAAGVGAYKVTTAQPAGGNLQHSSPKTLASLQLLCAVPL